MKTLCLAFLGLLALAAARPSDILNYSVETDNLDHEHEQEGTAGKAVEGEYSWTSPDGEEYVVKYIADHLGYRIVESNALPVAPEFDLDQPSTDVVDEEVDDAPISRVEEVPSRTVVVEVEEEEEEEDAPKFRTAEGDSDEEDENVRYYYYYYRADDGSDEDDK